MYDDDGVGEKVSARDVFSHEDFSGLSRVAAVARSDEEGSDEGVRFRSCSSRRFLSFYATALIFLLLIRERAFGVAVLKLRFCL